MTLAPSAGELPLILGNHLEAPTPTPEQLLGMAWQFARLRHCSDAAQGPWLSGTGGQFGHPSQSCSLGSSYLELPLLGRLQERPLNAFILRF